MSKVNPKDGGGNNNMVIVKYTQYTDGTIHAIVSDASTGAVIGDRYLNDAEIELFTSDNREIVDVDLSDRAVAKASLPNQPPDTVGSVSVEVTAEIRDIAATKKAAKEGRR